MKKPSKILYFGKKALAFLLSVLVLSLAVFYVSRLAPGDPLVSYYGNRAEKLTPQERAQAEEKLGLDEPIFPQYVRWAQNALHGDFGISYKYKMPAGEVIASRAGNTLLLGGVGFVLIFTLSLLLGMFCAQREGTLFDRAVCKLGTITSCIPEFWLSLLLILSSPSSCACCRAPGPTPSGSKITSPTAPRTSSCRLRSWCSGTCGTMPT